MKLYHIIILFFSFFIVLPAKIIAQEITLSETAELSILTMGPGDDLNDSFGHSAFRVKDTTQNIDVVYNYGVYDFNTPNFYLKFAQGKLLYTLDRNNFTPFYNYYSKQNRWIKEQVLNLNPSEKKDLFNFLQNNFKPENRTYKYDFFFDNCATKIRDVMATVLKGKISYQDGFESNSYTFRELIQKNVDWNTWGSFGMDIAIGAVVDRKATYWEYQFLPEYVFKATDKAKLNRGQEDIRLVKETIDLFNNSPKEKKPNFFTSPLFMMGLFAFIILGITYKDFKNNTRNRWLDVSIYSITGIIGVLLLLLWFATDHSTTHNNYNLLWAFPLSLFFVLAISKKNPKPWLKSYVVFQILMLGLIGIHWTTEVQVFTYGLIPLLIALLVRYLYLVFYFTSTLVR
ncbi:MAG: lipoprotein N-acyltransferase Lnb domain-containing protein [Flavobacteriales bacterium]